MRRRSPGETASRAEGQVHVTLKPGVLDPQGKAVQHSLAALGFAASSRSGRASTSRSIWRTTTARAREMLDAMCRQLLANTVIENYAIDIGE